MEVRPDEPRTVDYAPGHSETRWRPLRSPFVLQHLVIFGFFGLTSLVALGLSWWAPLRPRTQCCVNMRNLGAALSAYADGYGCFPDPAGDWGAALVSAGLIPPERLKCKAAGAAGSYIFVPFTTPDTDESSRVVAYENPANHGGQGGAILYQDGHSEWVSAPRFQAIIGSVPPVEGATNEED